MAAERVRVVSRDGQNVANVARRLRAEILNGEIPAGAVTSQVALGERLAVGRTPIREALRLLEREGLVVSAPNRRVRIAELSGADAEELYIMRIALETVAIRLTIPSLTSPHVAQLEGYMAQMDHHLRRQDWVRLREPHRAFHLLLVSAAGERAVREISALFDHAERYRLRCGGDREWQLRSEEHRSILDAAIARQPDQAARTLAEHYGHTARLVFAGLEPSHDAARLRETMKTTAPGSERALD